MAKTPQWLKDCGCDHADKKTYATGGAIDPPVKGKRARIIANSAYPEFKTEYERTKDQYAKHYPGGVDFIEASGYDELQKAFQGTGVDQDLIMMAHHNKDIMYGTPVSSSDIETLDARKGQTLASLFSGLQDRGYKANCYLGICEGEGVAKDLQKQGVNIPMFATTGNKKWFGANPGNKGNFDDFFFGITGTQDKGEYVTSPIDPEIGRDYNMFLSDKHQELMKRRASGTPQTSIQPKQNILQDMAKFKYLRGGRVFESDKQYNLPQIGIDGKLVTPKKMAKGGKVAYEGGGKKPNVKKDLINLDTSGIGKNIKPVATTGLGSGPALKSDIGSKPAQSFSSLLGSTAPFLDNVANLIATNKTPAISQPVMTNAPRLATKLNINPQKRRIENDVTAASSGIDRSTSSAGVANANKGKLLADKFRAIGDLEANKQNFEAEQGNRQAGMDFQAQSNNNQLVNKRNFDQMLRQDDINQRYASVVSDFGSDIANINRENNMMARDKDALKTIMKTNPDAAYQFADTEMFKTLYRDNEPELRKLIMSQKGTAQKAKLAGLYKQLFNRDFTE
jgi:hypothetical protein